MSSQVVRLSNLAMGQWRSADSTRHRFGDPERRVLVGGVSRGRRLYFKEVLRRYASSAWRRASPAALGSGGAVRRNSGGSRTFDGEVRGHHTGGAGL